MKRFRCTISDCLLSAFDLSGSLLLNKTTLQSKNFEDDTKQLLKDHETLMKDYNAAYEKTLREVEN